MGVDGLYSWLEDTMFKVSTTAFRGIRSLDVYLDLREETFVFNHHLLTMIFGVAKVFGPKTYRVPEKALSGFVRWQQ